MISEIFGRAGEGVHQHIFGIAIWDVVFTLIAVIAFAYYFDQNVVRVAAGAFLIAEGTHVLFGVDTAVTKLFLCK